MKKIIILILSIGILTGCTEYKEIDKNDVIDEKTNQRVVDNILCKTDDTVSNFERIKNEELEMLNNKLQNNELSQDEYNNQVNELNTIFNIDDVVKCNEFSILSGENGVWETIFVKPLSWLLLQLSDLTTFSGLAIIIVTILIRLALYPITKKTAMQSENMASARKKLTKVEEKYKNKADKESQMLKAQETMKVYKEFNINPMSGCLYAIIQIPLFFAFYEALYRLPVIFEESFLGINLGLNPTTAFSQGQWYYILIPIMVVAATYFSFKLNKATNPVGEHANQMKIMVNISVVMIAFASFTVFTGIALYWIVNSSFTIVQNLIVKKEKKNAHII